MTLDQVTKNRDNNFNLIRILAAVAVLVSHAWIIAKGVGTPEPLQQIVGHSLGTLAVYVFFAISGFFISASFDRADSTMDFLTARVLRLIPALAVSSWLVAFALGPLVTTWALSDYLGAQQTWAFALRNSLPVSMLFHLPGVFETNPSPVPVSSIWTLPNEVVCYGMVLLTGLAGLLRRPVLFSFGPAAAIALLLLVKTGSLNLPLRLEALIELSVPFVFGSALYVWRSLVPIQGPKASLLAAGLALGTIVAHPTPVFDLMLVLAITYLSFWLAYRPGDWIRRYNRMGDYSYGTYLYAYPVQGLMIWLFGPMSPWTNVALALPVTFVCAVASWHWVEAPALALRHKLRRRP